MKAQFSQSYGKHPEEYNPFNHISLKPGTLLAPLPAALATMGQGEEANAITLAWAGIINSDPPMLSISVRPVRHSHALLESYGRFALHLTDEKMAEGVDYCGMASGRKVNKFEHLGWVPHYPGKDSPPLLSQSPLILVCKIVDQKTWGTHTCFTALIEAVWARPDCLGSDGRLQLERAGLLVYNHGLYQQLGKVLGFFGYSVARPAVRERRLREIYRKSGERSPRRRSKQFNKTRRSNKIKK